MTKDKLKKEAEENSFRYTLDKPWACEVERKQIMAHFEKGYLASAEPREKRIAELEEDLKYQNQARTIAENAVVNLTDKIADIKANCDLAIEGRDVKIKELEQKLNIKTELSKRLGVAYREYEQLTKEQDEHIVELEKGCEETQELLDKQIEATYKLDKENAELQHKVDTLQGFLDHDIEYDMDKAIQNLKKKNAEFKARLNAINLLTPELEKLSKAKTKQLTEAKELIENIIRVTWGEGWNYSLDWKVKAEQFIKEIKENGV